MPTLIIKAIDCKVHSGGVDEAPIRALGDVIRAAAQVGTASAPFLGPDGAAIAAALAAAGAVIGSVVDLAVAIDRAGQYPDQLYLNQSNRAGVARIWPPTGDYQYIRSGQVARTHIEVPFQDVVDVNFWEWDSGSPDDYLGRLSVDPSHAGGIRYQVIASEAEGCVYVVSYSVVDVGTAGQVQTGWRWCRNCQGLHFIENGDRPCPAGGAHISDGSGSYKLSLGDPTVSGQIWRWCSKCAGLHFTENGLRPCPAGGDHSDQGSGEYRLLELGNPQAFGQPFWFWCSKCGGLHFMGGGNAGVCPGGGAHSAQGSGNYVLRND